MGIGARPGFHKRERESKFRQTEVALSEVSSAMRTWRVPEVLLGGVRKQVQKTQRNRRRIQMKIQMKTRRKTQMKALMKVEILMKAGSKGDYDIY